MAVLRESREWSPKQYSVSSNEEPDEVEDDEHLDAEDAILSPNDVNDDNEQQQNTMNDVGLGDDDEFLQGSGLRDHDNDNYEGSSDNDEK